MKEKIKSAETCANIDKIKNYLLSNMKFLAGNYSNNEFYHLVNGITETILNESFIIGKQIEWDYYSSSIYGYLHCCDVTFLSIAIDLIDVLEREALTQLIIVEEFLTCANIKEACRIFREIFEK